MELNEDIENRGKPTFVRLVALEKPFKRIYALPFRMEKAISGRLRIL